MKKRKAPVTVKQKDSMRKTVKKKKSNNHGGVFQEHRFCIAYLKIIEDPRGTLFKECTYKHKPKDSCDMCDCNRRKQRWAYV